MVDNLGTELRADLVHLPFFSFSTCVAAGTFFTKSRIRAICGATAYAHLRSGGACPLRPHTSFCGWPKLMRQRGRDCLISMASKRRRELFVKLQSKKILTAGIHQTVLLLLQNGVRVLALIISIDVFRNLYLVAHQVPSIATRCQSMPSNFAMFGSVPSLS